MVTKEKALKIRESDERLTLSYYSQILRYSHSYKRKILKAIEDIVGDFDVLTGKPQDYDLLRSIIRDLPRIMTGQISTDLIRSYEDVVDRRLRSANAMMVKLELPGGVIQPEKLGSVITRKANIAQAVINAETRGLESVQEQVSKYLTAMSNGQSVTRASLISDMTSKAGVAPQYANTIAQTELAAVDREVRIKQTVSAGLDQMMYVGSVDSVTRDFCLRWVGEVRSIEFWESIANPTDPNPVSVYGGGYNCRHRLVPFNPEWE
jgi:hypothetical protein